MIGKKKISLTVSVNWLIITGSISVVLIFLFALLDNHRPLFTFSMAVLAGAAAYIVAINAIDARRAETELSRKLAALEYIHKWNDPLFADTKNNCRETIKEFSGFKNGIEKKEFLDSDTAKLGNLIDVLNLFESMSIAIDEGIANEDVARRFFRSIVFQYWNNSADFIIARRIEVNNARFFNELESLYERWKDK